MRTRDEGHARPRASVERAHRVRADARGILSGVLALAGTGLALPTSPQDPRAFVEAVPPADAVYVGGAFDVTLRFGVERALYEAGLPQLFAQPLDVPVQLEVPWLDAPPFGRALATHDDGGSSPMTFALEHGPARANRVSSPPRDGREYVVLEYERGFVAERSGRFTLAAPRLRFASATRVEKDVFDAPVAVDTTLVTIEGAPLELEVRELPEAGRPPEFSGAVGRFTLSAEATPRELAVGAELELAVTLGGQGYLGGIVAPRVEDAPLWNVLGVLDEAGPSGRVFRYHLQPTSSAASATPRVEFAYFDTESASYRTLESPALAVRVTERATTESDAPREAKPARTRWGPWASSLVLMTVLLAAGRRRRRAAARAARERAALAELERELARPGANLEAAWTAFLAAELGLEPTAISAHDVAARLARAGASQDVAERAALALGGLVGARYGGAAPRTTPAELTALANELTRELALGRAPRA